MIGKTISHYKILEKLGEGGMGVVYKAEDTKLKRTVALKFLPQEFTRDSQAKQRFIKEAQAASSMDHNNVCTIHEIDETKDGQTFIAMACYEGETLRDKISRGPLLCEEAVDITLQIAEGLTKAHKKGIVHRDIKPANIFITDDGVVKILDFGLAKLAGPSQLTKTGTTLGTVFYMSPEQARGEEVDHRTDLWSLGVILYEMLTGEVPFKGDYEQAVIYSILNEDPLNIPDNLADIPSEVNDIINTLLAKDRSSRYSDTSAFIDIVLEVCDEHGLSAGRHRSFIGKARTWSVASILQNKLVILTSVLVILGIVYVLFFPNNKLFSRDALSVGVLYLKNLGEEADDYYSYGITEDIIIDLSKAGVIRVPAMNDILAYQNSEETLSEIAEQLDVRYILTGSLRKENEQFRLAMQLIEAHNNRNLWSERWEEPIDEMPSIKGKIIQEVVASIGLKTDKETMQQLSKKPTPNADAYEYYLKGKYRLNHMETAEDLEMTKEFFDIAIRLDSLFVLPRILLGQAYYIAGDYDTALLHYHKSLKISRKQEFPLDEAATLINIGAIFHDRGQYDEALDYFNNALTIAQRTGDKSTEGECYRNIGIIYDGRSAYQEALDYFNRSLGIARKLQDNQGIYMNFNSLGIVYNKMGENNKALDYMQKSLDLRLEMGHKRGAALVMYNMATIYDRRKDFENTEKHLTNALRIFEDIGMPSGVSYALSGLGNLYYSLGQFDKALDTLNHALSMHKEMEDRSAVGYTLNNIAGVYHQKKEYEYALDNATEALKIFEDLNDKWMSGNVHTAIGSIYFDRDTIQAAKEYFQQAVEILSSLDIKIELLHPLSYLILCNHLSDQQAPSDSLVNQLDQLIQQVDPADVDHEVLWNLSQIYGFRGQKELEEEYLECAYERMQNLAKNIRSKSDRERYLSAFRVNRDIVEAWENKNN